VIYPFGTPLSKVQVSQPLPDTPVFEPGKPYHRRPADYAAAPLANPPPEWDLAGVPAQKVSSELARWEFLKLPPASLDRTPANAIAAQADAPGACGTVLAAPLASTGEVYGAAARLWPDSSGLLCADMNWAAAP